MKKKKLNFTKIFLNLVFQVSVLFIIFSFFKLDISKVNFIFSKKIILLFFFLIGLKFFISTLFFMILKVFSNSKTINYLNMTNIFLQGGVVNQLLPGAGLAFKYYKLKTELNVTLAQFTVSQTILSLSSLANYITLAFVLGVLLIKIDTGILFYIIILIVFTMSFIYLKRKYIYNTFKQKIIKIKKIKNIYIELSNIKLILVKKKKFFIFIYIGFFILASLECLAFYLAIYLYGLDIDFITANFLYLSSSLVTVISVVNFIGLFEIIITFSASLISNYYQEIIYISLGYKIINTTALLFSIFINRLIRQLIK